MNNSNPNFNQGNSFGTDGYSSQQAPHYEYVFSGMNSAGTPPTYHRKEKSMNRGLFMLLCVVLCAVVSFGAAFGGTILGRNMGDGNTLVAPNGSLNNSDPGSILDKKESEFSAYGSAGENVLSISQVVHKVEDAIVVINASVYTSSIWGGIQESTSAGSGVIVSDQGYILTCYHVIENSRKIRVTLTSGNTYDASVVGTDPYSDLAVLKIAPQETLTSVRQGCSADLVVGEYVIAIGNPLGTLSGTVTTGIISATERKITMTDGTKMSLIQTDAAINSGNSGGGLFNLQGDLIGIVNAKYASSGVEGLAFAIPIDVAYDVQKDLIRDGYVRGIIDTGLTLRTVTAEALASDPDYFSRNSITAPGVYVIDSDYCTELVYKDRIVSVNGVAVNTSAEFEAEIEKCKAGDTVTIVASRAGSEFSVQLTLKEYVPQSSAQ